MADVIIIGGGPAGATMGSYLSMAGIDNVIIEGANFPRPHVGESLVTSTTRVFQDIGFLPTMESTGFVRKYGACWHAPNGREFAIEFREFPQSGIDQEYSYHVERGQFDLMLLKHAESLGSKVYQGVRVQRVLFEGEQACGVRIAIDGREVDLPCKIVVDASGRGTMIANQLRMKQKDPLFNQYAVGAWFKGVDRGMEPEADYIHIYFLPVERGWAWQIPLDDETTSVGVVAEREVFKHAKLDLESYFQYHVRTNPGLERAMASAMRVSNFNPEGDYSYSVDRYVGDGYILIGDAARFVDPIFSSGISIAMYSAQFASERIREAFARNDFSREVFEPYEEKLRKGVSVWYEFIRLYYKLLPLFTHFIQSDEHRLSVLQLLQGEVFDRDTVPVLDAMREYIESVEKMDKHLLRDALTSIPVD